MTNNSVRDYLSDPRHVGRRRRDGINLALAFPAPNVINATQWSYARACLKCEIASADCRRTELELKLAEDGIRREFAGLIRVITKGVLDELKKKKPARPPKKKYPLQTATVPSSRDAVLITGNAARR